MTETIDQIKTGLGYIVVKIDEPLVEKIKRGALVLQFNPTYNLYKNAKISAEVVSECAKLPKTPFFLKESGFPAPVMRYLPDGTINPTPYEPEYVTVADQENVVRKGDKVYFKYLTLFESNYIGKDDDGMKLYKCPYDQIFCTISLGVIVMANGYILVEPLWSENYVEIEIDQLNHRAQPTGEKRKLRVQMSRQGIITDIEHKPMAMNGTVRHIGVPIDNRNYGFTVNDKVIYLKGSEFKNEIEGKEYYVMKQWDVVAKVIDKKLVPVGDYVILMPEIPTKDIVWTPKEKKPVKATVISVGNRVNQVVPGDIVHYNHSKSWTMDVQNHEGVICKANQIWARYE